MDWKKLDVKKKKGVCVHCVSKNGDLDVGDAGIDKIRKWG